MRARILYSLLGALTLLAPVAAAKAKPKGKPAPAGAGWQTLVGGEAAVGGKLQDFPGRLLRAANGDVLLTGLSDPYGEGEKNHGLFLATLTPKGKLTAWTYLKRTGAEDVSLGDGIVSPQGDAVVAGKISVGYPVLIKYDAKGGVVWSREYADLSGSPDAASPGLVFPKAGGGFYLLALTGSHGLAVITADAQGHKTGMKMLKGHFGGSHAGSVVAAGDGFIAAGEAGDDVHLTGLSKDFQITWEKTLARPGKQEGAGIVALGNDAFMAFALDSVTPQHQIPHLLRVDAKGTLVWDKAYDAPETVLEQVGHVVQSGANLFFCGYRSTKTGSFSRIVRIDGGNGNVVWEKKVPDGSCMGALADGEGGALFAFQTGAYGAKGIDALIVRVDANGNMGTAPKGQAKL
jgi:hypothetical protein